MWSKDHQTNTRKPLTLDWLIKTKIGVASVEILLILKGSSAQQKMSMQGMPQVWPLHKPLFPENPTKTSQLQAQKTHCASVEGWDHSCM